MRKSRLALTWLPALGWAAVIFATSSTVIHSKQFVHGVVASSAGHLTPSEFAGFWDRRWWVFVKGYHVLEYLLLTLLVVRGLRASEPRWRLLRLPLAASLTLLYAASDEFHQTFIPGRGGTASDVLVDSIGVLLALALRIEKGPRRIRSAGSV